MQIENKFYALKRFSLKYDYRFGFVRDRNDALYLNRTEYVERMTDASRERIETIF